MLFLCLIVTALLSWIVFTILLNIDCDSEKKSESNNYSISSLLPPKPQEIFDLPEYDEVGHARLYLSHLALTGITYEHFGTNPQKIIPNLRMGEQVTLRPDPHNRYDKNAISVHTVNGNFIGWIPRGRNKDLFKRLVEGQTVLARVEGTGKATRRIYENYNDDFDDDYDEYEDDYDQYEDDNYYEESYYTCSIEVARYSKHIKKKSH